jgi:uncharacterized protein
VVTPDLPEQLRGLLRPTAYPHPVTAIELVQTHVSWILLTGEFAYKLKRPVRYAFVDLSTPERREFSCREELRLNRRFAAELYLDVCAITDVNGAARIGGEGRTIEYAVKMLQFERAAELDQLLAARAIEPAELEAFGHELVEIHERLPRIAPADPWGRPENVQALVLRNIDECVQAAESLGCQSEVHALREPLAARLAALAECMAERRVAGRVRECHGDLHAGNIVRRGSRLVAFDCMEFEPAFRWIDLADEVAFLLSDMAARGYASHAHAFLAGYLAQGGDYQACRLLRAYQAHRTLIRAKVATLSADGAGERDFADLREKFTRLVRYAACVIAPRQPRLVLTFGLSGSGKTWLARQLAERLGAIHLRSDVARKRLAGLADDGRSNSALGGDLYAHGATAQVYAQLGHDAEEVLAGGYDVIVDATFGRREQRGRFRQLAQRLGVGISLINCHAPVEVLRARIGARRAAGGDASEADEPVLEWQIRHHEALDADEAARAISADTANTSVVDLVAEELDAPHAGR